MGAASLGNHLDVSRVNVPFQRAFFDKPDMPSALLCRYWITRLASSLRARKDAADNDVNAGSTCQKVEGKKVPPSVFCRASFD
ncbi:hypothetical protein CDAR_433461 [Caerostris darwini]|uniref:Uncharacterized protein n=1 Tax=Caerostris darwini TaxID=1538125 RepID=A0AAV4WFH4_9ARAC|nr:hypothetical protein CDAR_433461 [Caerostris darwini]